MDFFWWIEISFSRKKKVSSFLLAFSIMFIKNHCISMNSVEKSGLVQNISIAYMLCSVPDASLH